MGGSIGPPTSGDGASAMGTVGFEEILRLAASADRAAADLGIAVVVSVVDADGNQRLVHRSDEAPIESTESALRTARAAAASGSGPLSPTGARVRLAGGDWFGLGVAGGTIDEDAEILRVALLTLDPAASEVSRPAPSEPRRPS